MADPAPAAAAEADPPVRRVTVHHTDPQALTTIVNLSNNVELELLGFGFELGSDLFTTLCSGVSVPTLVLTRCDMADPAQYEQGALALATSVNAENLKIIYCTDPFVFALLRNLVNNTSVKNLSLQFRLLSDNVSTAIRQLLETSKTLRGLDFGPNDSTNTLRNAPHQPFEALLRAVANSKLERFSVGLLQHQHQVRSVSNIIPSLRIHELNITVYADAQFDREEGNMIDAIMRNRYLHSVHGSIGGRARQTVRPWVDQSQYIPRPIFDRIPETLRSHFNRNKKLHRWAAKENNPDRLVLKDGLFPRAVQVAKKAGINMLFTSLKSNLPEYASNVTLPRRQQPPQPARPPPPQQPNTPLSTPPRKRPRVGQFSPPSW